MSFQWFRNGAAVPGQNTSTFHSQSVAAYTNHVDLSAGDTVDS